MFAICTQGTSAQGRTGIGTVIVRGEEVSRVSRRNADLAKASLVRTEEDMIGSEEFAVCLNLWMRAKKRMEWRSEELEVGLGPPQLPESPSERST